MKMLILWTVSFWCAAGFALEESCDCPKLGCDPCSVEHGVTFYTSKCGPQQSRLKSCARPTCIPIEQASKECPVPPAADSGPREPVVVKEAGPAKADVNADVRIVGTVKVMAGSVSILRADGHRLAVNGEAKVRETDTIESSADGGALVTFDGGNKLHIHPGTSVQVKEYKDQADPDARKALLQLIKGKIRSQVEQKYNGKTSSYKVYTTGAVAGVRGTDFVMEHNEGKSLDTRVETLTGHVTLASLDEKEKRDVLRGEGASFHADLPGSDYKGDLTDFVRKGKLSPVYKIPGDRLMLLDNDSRVDVAKAPKVKHQREAEICQKPKGYFNQCAWTCVGNPAKEKACRVDLPNVACVRTRCNGNGQWADETRLNSAEAKGLCPGEGVTVKDCDY
jgi:hypothetical protein